MDPALSAAFIASVAVLMLIPGPNVALIVANSMAYGPRFGLLTVAGTSSAMIVQLALVALGMTELLGKFSVWFTWLRWAGAIYLVCLGIRYWRATVADLGAVAPQPKSVRNIFVRAMIVSLTNPKTLFFYGAFFPQFISPDRPIAAQVVALSITFLLLAVFIDSGWALLAARLRVLLNVSGRFWNRLSGSLLIGAGTALALARNR